jgi:outer membrane cobalamin receptor
MPVQHSVRQTLRNLAPTVCMKVLSRYEIGNANLSPERSYQADATLEYGSGFVTGSFGIYENYIHNLHLRSKHQ